MTVIDASTLAAIILREEGWRRLASHLKGAITLDQALKEAANAIWKAVMRNYLRPQEAANAFKLLKSLTEILEIADEAEYLDEAFRISIERRLAVYDSLYIALAREKGKPILTLDEKQGKIAEELGVLRLLSD